MPLTSKLFTQPPDPDLEACLVSDAKHITPGSKGEHVRKIQIAINSLTQGPGRENIFLVMDGIYGPKTAAAVKRYKDAPQRRILQPWQTSADDIVGKRTIKSLDDEMAIFEEEDNPESDFISRTHSGPKHDHSKCPGAPLAADLGPDKKVTHIGTPMNPLRFGRMINIGGEFEAVDFEDFLPDPNIDPDPILKMAKVGHRKFTSILPSHSVSDILFRSTPIDKFMREKEIPRICMVGTRLTCVGDTAKSADALNYFQTVGIIFDRGKIADQDIPGGFRDYAIVTIMKVDPN